MCLLSILIVSSEQGGRKCFFFFGFWEDRILFFGKFLFSPVKTTCLRIYCSLDGDKSREIVPTEEVFFVDF